MSAQRAGLVRIATAEACADVVAGFEPAYMTVALADDGAGRIASAALETVLQQCDAADAVALGPGLGRSDGLDELVTRMIADVACPLVVDADGLNALASRTDVLPGAAGPRVLTPHSGEFARLVGADQPLPLDDARDRADLFAAEHGVVVVLKGHRTYITDGDTRLERDGQPRDGDRRIGGRAHGDDQRAVGPGIVVLRRGAAGNARARPGGRPRSP
ncbi:MAG: ADP/ATP-dependent (S)-NAD(P)H-hydrate dehydratase [Pirellulales bacterium]